MIKRWGLPILLAGTAFVILPVFELPYEISKLLFFRIFLNVFLFFWGIIVIRDQTVSFPRVETKILFGILAVIAANIFSFIASFDMERSFLGSPYRCEGIYTLLHYAALFLLTLGIFQKKYWKDFEITFGIIITGLSLISFWQYFVSKDTYFYGRPVATIGNPVYLGQLLDLLIPILVTIFLTRKNKYIWGIILGLSAVTIFLSGSRGALLGLVSGLIFYAAFAAWKFHIKKLRWFIGIFVSAIVLFLILLNLFANRQWIQDNRVLRRLTFIQYDSVRPIQSRFEIWRATADMIKDYPILGVGQDTFDLAFQSYAPLPLQQNPTQYADRAHNLTLDLIASYGIFGFLLYAFFFISLFIGSLRNFKKTTDRKSALIVLGILSGFISLIIATQFNFFVLIHHVFFWTLAGILLRFLAHGEKKLTWKLIPIFQYALIFFLTIIIALNIVIFNIIPATQMFIVPIS